MSRAATSVGGLPRQRGGDQREVAGGDAREQAAVPATAALQNTRRRHVLVDGGDETVHPRRVPQPGIRVGACRQLRFQPEHHTLAVGVLSAHQRAGLDAVEHQVGLRVDQRSVDPVTHLLGAPQPVVVAGQEDPRRPVGRGVEELVLLAPRDPATVLGHPRFDELVGELR